MPGRARTVTVVTVTVHAELAGQLIEVLRSSTGSPDLEYGRRPQPMRGGFWADIFSFSLANQPDGWPAELVARLTPAAVWRLARRVPGPVATMMARLHELPPDLMISELAQVTEVPVTVTGLVRPDLAAAAGWLADHPLAPAQDVICHGDLHPFNLLADGDRMTLLDWSTAVLGPPAYDVAFTSLLRCYRRQTTTAVESSAVRWHQGVVCLRALVEAAGWAHDGSLPGRSAHPWVVLGPAEGDCSVPLGRLAYLIV